MIKKAVFNMLLGQLTQNVPKNDQERIHDKLLRASELTIQELAQVKLKNHHFGIMLSLVFGFLGADRFYRGAYFSGFLKLCFCFVFAFAFNFANLITQLANQSQSIYNAIQGYDILFNLANIYQENSIILFVLNILAWCWIIVDFLFISHHIKTCNLKKILGIFAR